MYSRLHNIGRKQVMPLPSGLLDLAIVYLYTKECLNNAPYADAVYTHIIGEVHIFLKLDYVQSKCG